MANDEQLEKDRRRAMTALRRQKRALGKLADKLLEMGNQQDRVGEIQGKIAIINTQIRSLKNATHFTPPTKQQMKDLKAAADDIRSVVKGNASAQAILEAAVELGKAYNSGLA